MSEVVSAQLPTGWTRASLEDCVEILDGLRVPVNSQDRSKRLGDVPYYGATGQVGWIDQPIFNETLVLLGEDGAPFFDKTRHVAYVVRGKAWVNNHAHVLRASRGISAPLLAHQLNVIDYRGFVTGTTRWKLSQGPMRKIELAIPPEAEQERIADTLDELLSDLDAGVAALERVRAKLKHYRAAVLKAAVEGSLTEQWRREHPATETADALLTRILAERRRRWEQAQLAKFEKAGKTPPKDWRAKYVEPTSVSKDRFPLPSGWSWVTLDQLVWSLRSGSSETSGRATTGFPVLRSSAVRPGCIDLNDLNFLTEAQSKRLENFLERNDFLITRLSGSVEYVGCSAVVGDLGEERIQYPDRIFCGKLVIGGSGLYLTYAFQHPWVRRALESAAKSTAGHKRISISDLLPLTVPFPPQNEQDAIVEAVEDQLSVIDHLERDLDARLKSAQSLRQSILRHAFTGQLVPQDPSDEPASELLKRIAAEREERARLLRAAKPSKPNTRTPRARGQKK